MRRLVQLVLLPTALLVAATGCTLSDEGPADPSPTRPATTAPAPPPTASGTTSPTAPTGGAATLPGDLRTRPAVAAAIADTAERARARPDEVVIAAWSPVTWNDGSLGCPKKGMSYTQATVPGELLMLRVGTALFQYHARTGGPFSYCATPSAAWSVGG